jgi:hypothetical protein
MAIDGTTRLPRFRSKESVTLDDLSTAMGWGAGSGSVTVADGSITTTKLGGDITTAGKALLDDASATAQRVTLGLGTAATANSTAFEASGAVSTHASLTSGVHGISSFGETLVDDADAAAARTTLGLGTAATAASTAFEASGTVATHAALTTAHGISSFGTSLVSAASATAARTTLGLGTAATAATTAFEASGAVSTHAALTSGVHGISTFGATLVAATSSASARTILGETGDLGYHYAINSGYFI